MEACLLIGHFINVRVNYTAPLVYDNSLLYTAVLPVPYLFSKSLHFFIVKIKGIKGFTYIIYIEKTGRYSTYIPVHRKCVLCTFHYILHFLILILFLYGILCCICGMWDICGTGSIRGNLNVF